MWTLESLIYKSIQKFPYSLQRFIIFMGGEIKRSFFAWIIYFFILLCKRKRIPYFCYLKHFTIKSLLKEEIILWKNVILWKNFRCMSSWKVEIWDYTYLASNNMITPSDNYSIIIGKYCSIADWVSIIAWHYHDHQFISTFPFFDYESWWNINIWNDVRIWKNAIILKGVTVWDWAVIWAGAVVSKDVPPYWIVWWVPAKLITYRFSKDKIEKLLKNKWRNNETKQIIKLMRNLQQNTENDI